MMASARPYHHGNLESAIIDLSVTEIERVGYEKLSLREIATAVGVSRGAPYRHFPNRLSFLEAVAARGLQIMDGQLGNVASRHNDPVDKLRAVFSQFLQFAQDHPQLYRLCFASDMFIESEPDEHFKEEAYRRFSYFAMYIAKLVPHLSRQELELQTVSCWSFLHGFAVLSATQRIHHVLANPDREAASRALVVEQCLRLPGLNLNI